MSTSKGAVASREELVKVGKAANGVSVTFGCFRRVKAEHACVVSKGAWGGVWLPVSEARREYVRV